MKNIKDSYSAIEWKNMKNNEHLKWETNIQIIKDRLGSVTLGYLEYYSTIRRLNELLVSIGKFHGSWFSPWNFPSQQAHQHLCQRDRNLPTKVMALKP